MVAKELKYLLLQVRDSGDPMELQERAAFVDALRCEPSDMLYWNLLNGPPRADLIGRSDVVFIGGSGHYSVTVDDDWMGPALEAIRQLFDRNKPMFAVCWGFQALALALGGTVCTDLERAQLGTYEIQLTASGKADNVFGADGDSLVVFQGHQDRVVDPPPGAVVLAETPRVPCQAFGFPDRPVYATQFHPELNRERFLERVRNYPEYISRITGQTYDEFEKGCVDASSSQGLLRRFVAHIGKEST